MKNNTTKLHQQAECCKEVLQKYRDMVARIERSLYYSYHPTLKAARIRNCLLKMQVIERQIRCAENKPAVDEKPDQNDG